MLFLLFSGPIAYFWVASARADIKVLGARFVFVGAYVIPFAILFGVHKLFPTPDGERPTPGAARVWREVTFNNGEQNIPAHRIRMRKVTTLGDVIPEHVEEERESQVPERYRVVCRFDQNLDKLDFNLTTPDPMVGPLTRRYSVPRQGPEWRDMKLEDGVVQEVKP